MPLLRKSSNPTKRFFGVSAFFISALFCFASSANAQQAQIAALATKTAEAISKAHEKSVIVADFWSPQNRLTELGQTLADQFSAELVGLGTLKVQDRGRLQKVVEQNVLSPLALRDIDIAAWMGHEAGAKVIVVGDIVSQDGHYKLMIAIFTVQTGKNLGNFDVTMTGSPEWKSLFQLLAQGTAPTPPTAGEDGYTTPQCVYCPNPQYSDAAFRQGLQGMVVLSVIAGSDGKPHDIVVLKKLGLGLDESAVRALQNYRFKPANGPDGKPTAVQMLFEMEFRRR